MGNQMQAKPAVVHEKAKYCATVGESQRLGRMPSEAISDLIGNLGDATQTPILIWSYDYDDQYSSKTQQQRLLEISFDAAIAWTQAVLGDTH